MKGRKKEGERDKRRGEGEGEGKERLFGLSFGYNSRSGCGPLAKAVRHGLGWVVNKSLTSCARKRNKKMECPQSPLKAWLQ